MTPGTKFISNNRRRVTVGLGPARQFASLTARLIVREITETISRGGRYAAFRIQSARWIYGFEVEVYVDDCLVLVESQSQLSLVSHGGRYAAFRIAPLDLRFKQSKH